MAAWREAAYDELLREPSFLLSACFVEMWQMSGGVDAAPQERYRPETPDPGAEKFQAQHEEDHHHDDGVVICHELFDGGE